MNKSFDPYLKWMGIPPEEQPPNYYRLLGIPPLTSDVEVIINAATQRLTHLESLKNGAHAAEAAALMQEVNVAQQTLLNIKLRSAYDQSLQHRQAPMHQGPVPMHPNAMPMHQSPAPRHPGPAPMQQRPAPMHQSPMPMHPNAAPVHPRQAPQRAVQNPAMMQPVPPQQPPPLRPNAPLEDPAVAGFVPPPEVPAAPVVAVENLLGGASPVGTIFTSNKKQKFSLVKTLVSYVLGGAGGLALGYFGLCMFNANYDFLGLLPKVRSFMASSDTEQQPTDPPPADNADLEAIALNLVEEKGTSTKDFVEDMTDQVGTEEAPKKEVEKPVESETESDENVLAAKFASDEPFIDILQPTPGQPEIGLFGRDKIPAPSKEEQDKAKVQIGQLYRSKYESAKSPEQKVELAKTFIDLGKATNDDNVGRFVLFVLARDIAAVAGSAPTAWDAINQLDEKYVVDAETMRVDAAVLAGANVILPKDHADIVRLTRSLRDGFVARDEYEKALKLSQMILNAAQKSRSVQLFKQAQASNDQITKLAAGFDAIEPQRKLLTTVPEEPDANLAVGRFYCFVKQDWERGLPHLARGSDEALKKLAALEANAMSKIPTDLAAGWWELAGQLDGDEKQAVHDRAITWYRRALSTTSGLALQLAIERIGADVRERLKDVYVRRECLSAHTFERSDLRAVRNLPTSVDASGNERHGLVNRITAAPGKVGSAAQFDGVRSFIEIPQLREDLMGEPTFTVCAWCKPQEKNEAFIFSVGQTSASGLSVAAMRNDLTVFVGSVSRGGVFFRTDKPNGDEWFHLAVTCDGNEVLIVVDGRVQARQKTTITAFDDTNFGGANFRIGSAADKAMQSIRYYSGLLDEVAIFKSGLTVDEIQDLYIAGTLGYNINP